MQNVFLQSWVWQSNCGQEITLKTDGENEEEAMNKLSAFLEENL